MKHIEFIPVYKHTDWKKGFVLWIGSLLITWNWLAYRDPNMDIRSPISIGWYPD